MSKRIVIVSGGEIDSETALSVLEQPESRYIIAVDKGMEFLYSEKIMPSYIVGDFDSVNEEVAEIMGVSLEVLHSMLYRAKKCSTK